MEILAWNSDKQRLATMDVDFTKKTRRGLRNTRESDIQRITDVDGGILIGKAGYDYPVWIGGKSRADIGYSRKKARELKKVYALKPSRKTSGGEGETPVALRAPPFPPPPKTPKKPPPRKTKTWGLSLR